MIRSRGRRTAATVTTFAVAAAACVLPVLLLGPTIRAFGALGRPGAEPGTTAASALLGTAAFGASVWLAVGVGVALFGAATKTACAFARTVPTRRLLDALLRAALSGTIAATALPAAGAAYAAPPTSAPASATPSGAVRLDVGPDGRFVVRDMHPTTTTRATGTTVAPTTTGAPTTTAAVTTTTAAPPPPVPAPTARPPRASDPSPRPSPRPSPPPATAARGTRHHVVVRGEHLWAIARHELTERLGRVPTDAELVPFWRRVCERTRATLRSGDVDLVFPGEVVELPET